MHSSPPARTPKLKLAAEILSTGECWITPKKKKKIKSITHPRAKEKTQQDCRGGKITFRIKPHTYQSHLECSNKPSVHQDPGTPQRLSQNCI